MLPLKLPKEDKESIVEELQYYFETERGEQIGNLAAEGLLDFLIKVAAPHIYNQAVRDSRKILLERMTSLEEELYTLEKPIRR
ncbi:DUF2164 domain-containing protein [Bacillus salitolerans]|uniref:DUF2164 domain-containing protein n=1 Tax=Bacillus salitolerans TaxID=1437434 RepID=A0ABW4LQ69_9BACI